MTEQPLVSVVLCTYNGSKYLQEQLDSIFSQTYPHIEIIAVDDASTDNTVELLRRYEQRPGFRIHVNEQNIGYNKNFERGCSLVTGEYIAIADQDDIWDKQKVELLMNAFAGSPDILLTHCHSAIFETGKAPHRGSVRARRSFSGNDVRGFFLYNQISGHNMIFRRSLLRWALPFPAGMYYDWWLAIVACCNGAIKGVDAILVYQRKHAANATRTEKKPTAFYQAVLQRLPVWLTAPNMREEDRLFGKKLVEKFSVLTRQSFSYPLFWFILAHAHIVFSFKRKLFPYISYIKHARRVASAATPAP